MPSYKQSSGLRTPAVITSKAATKDLEDIQLHHEEMLSGMATQSMRVQQYNAQKGAELQAEQSMQNEMKKEKMANDTEVQGQAMDFAMKQAELDVKRAALAAK